MTKQAPLDWMFDLDDVPPDGLEIVRAASDDERVRIARDLQIQSVEALELLCTITRWRKSGARIAGTLTADMTQTCGITLDPVSTHLAEDIDVRLLPEADLARLSSTHTGEDAFGPDDRDPPDVFDGSAIDLGMIAREHLALGLDPYPRAQGAEFEGYETGSDVPEAPMESQEASSPFAGLSALKNREDGGAQ